MNCGQQTTSTSATSWRVCRKFLISRRISISYELLETRSRQRLTRPSATGFMGATGSRRPAVRPTLCCSSGLVSTSSCCHGQGSSGPECSSLMSLDSHRPPTTRELRFHDVCVKENDRYGGSWSLVALGGLIRTEPHNTPSPCPREQYRHCLQRWHIVYRVGILSTEMAYCLQSWHIVYRNGILSTDMAFCSLSFCRHRRPWGKTTTPVPHRAHAVNDFLRRQQVTRKDWPAPSFT